MAKATKKKAVKVKFQKGTAKSVKQIKAKKSKGGGFGNMLWVKADESKLVRILAEPKDWIEYTYVGLEKNSDGDKMNYRKLPAYEGYGDDFVGADALRERTQFVIPVVEIDDDGKPGDRVMYYEPGNKVLDTLLNRFERSKTLTDRDMEIIKEGSGKNTTYDLYFHDPKKRGKLLDKFGESENWPDIDEDLLRMVKEARAEFDKDAEEEDEDDEPKSKKSKAKKSKAAKKRAMVEEDDDEDEESEEEAEDDDDDADDGDEDSDDGEDDGEDEEDEGDELPSEDEVDAMEFKELKAFVKEHEIEVKSGAKSKGHRDAIKSWLEEQGEDDGEESEDDEEDDGEEEETEDRVEDTFVMSNIDTDAFTVDLEDTEGTEYETVYLDRERDKVKSYKDGAKYKFVIELDDQQDWVAVTSPAATAKPKKAAAAKGKKGKGKSKK